MTKRVIPPNHTGKSLACRSNIHFETGLLIRHIEHLAVWDDRDLAEFLQQ